MEVPIVDRSPIDMLLSGDYAAREPRPPHHRYKIKSDPSVLPLGYWHMRSQEYRTFNQRKKIDVKLTPIHTEHLPSSLKWLPGFIKWPLERWLSGFLGETDRRPVHMGVEVCMPRLTLWLISPLRAGLVYACYALDALLLAWFFRSTVMDLQYLLLGWVGGLLLGIFLRARHERVFDWRHYGPALLASSFVIVGGLISAPRFYDLSHLVLPYKALSPDAEWQLTMTLQLVDVFGSLSVCLLPFMMDRLALRWKDDVNLLALLLLTLLRSFNLWVPFGAWLGGFIKVAPGPVPMEDAAAAPNAAAPTATMAPGSRGPAGGEPVVQKPAAPALQDEDLLVKRWRAPVASPYQSYQRPAYEPRGAPPAFSSLASRASAVAAGGGGGYGGPSASAFGSSLASPGLAPSNLLTDGRRSTPQRAYGASTATSAGASPYLGQGSYGGGLESTRPAAGGTPMRSLLTDVEDDGPPPISPAPFSSAGGETGLYSRRRSQRQQPAQPAYGMSGGGRYDAPVYASGGRRY